MLISLLNWHAEMSSTPWTFLLSWLLNSTISSITVPPYSKSMFLSHQHTLPLPWKSPTPCIDYRGLNQITVKYPYTLPLASSTLEQLQSAWVFTKLDLRSTYNLVCIWEGDKWKIAFSTTPGHYEYLVMPYGLACMPSVFHCLINDVLRDILYILCRL